jgi:DNA-binding MarR family transcriptional regulator
MRKPHTITALLNGMERAVLLRRIKDERNQKLLRVEMTEKGKEAWKRGVQSQLARELICSLDWEEFHLLSRMLEKLCDVAVRELGA